MKDKVQRGVDDVRETMAEIKGEVQREVDEAGQNIAGAGPAFPRFQPNSYPILTSV